MKTRLLFTVLLLTFVGATSYVCAQEAYELHIANITDASLISPNLSHPRNYMDGTKKREVYLTTETDWLQLIDPVFEGHKFRGWIGNYFTSHQFYKDSKRTGGEEYFYGSFTQPIDFDGTENSLYRVQQVGGRDFTTFTDMITVNLWAYMEDWSQFSGRLVSCTDGGGWYIGRNDGGKIRFQIYDAYKDNTTTTVKGNYHNLISDVEGLTKWADLGRNSWHMFTLVFDCTNAHAYVDGQEIASSPNFIKYNDERLIGYKKGVHIMFGGEPNGSNNYETAQGLFKGKMKNVVILNYHMSADEIATLYTQQYETRLHLNKSQGATSYKFEPAWVLLPKTTVNVVNEVVEDGDTIKASLPTWESYTGYGVSMPEPTRLDYLFKHWTGATAYVSNYQGLPFVNNSGTAEEIFTRPDEGGESNEVLFTGKNYYFIGDADNTAYHYTDSVTINVWATMADWSQYGSMRLFSCVGTNGGLNLAANSVGEIVFTGTDKHLNNADNTKVNVLRSTETNAIQPTTWASLNKGGIEDNWHMFTYVFDGQFIRGYVDGICVGISARFEDSKMVYDATKRIVIGAEVNGEETEIESGTAVFTGEMKNFTLMHMPLSPRQIHDLYNSEDGKSVVRYYCAPTNTDLGAAWNPLDKLEAANVELHTWPGVDVTSEKIVVIGNKKKDTQLALGAEAGAAAFTLSTDVFADGANGELEVTYSPETVYDASKSSSQTTLTVSDAAGWSTPKIYEVKGYTHKFEIVYWNRDGFDALMDSKLAECTVTIESADAKQTRTPSAKIVQRVDHTYFIPLTGKEGLSDTEAIITFTHPTGGWTLSGKMWIPKFVHDNEKDEAGNVILSLGEIENPAHDVMISGIHHEDGTTTATTFRLGKGRSAIGDLYIHPEATLILEEDAALQVNSLVLYSDGDDSPNLVIPAGCELTVQDASAATDPTIYLSKRITPERYYFFSLPYDCQVEHVHFADGSGGYRYAGGDTFKYDSSEGEIYLMRYDGEARVATAGKINSWRPVDMNGTLYAGIGYAVGIADGLGEKDVVFPMHIKNGALHESDNTTKETEIHAWGITDVEPQDRVAPNHLGWNLVGNPYLATYAYADNPNDVISDLKFGTITMEAEAANNGRVYMTVPIAGSDKYYEQKVYTNTAISPFSAFFVQVKQDGKMRFKVAASAEEPQTIAARRMTDAQVSKETFVGVTLSNGTYTDETALLVGNQFTQAYEIGSDLEKMLGKGEYPQVYVQDASYQYAFKSLSEADAAGTNDLGVYLPKVGEYTFAVNEDYDLSTVQAVYLTDKQENVEVNLLQTPYTFTSGKVHTAGRFSLSTVLAADVATNLTETAVTWSVWQDAALHIRVQNLCVGDEIRVFDSMGHLIEQAILHDTFASFSLPTEGAYCIQTLGADGRVQVKKIMVR